MGTFHDHSKMGAHHGMSVVIDTTGSKVYAGQCHEERPDEVILHNADIFDAASDANGRSKDDFVSAAAKFGIHNRHARVRVPRDEIASFRLLKDLR